MVLDLMLPGQTDGYSLCRELRAGSAGEANKDVPMIMLTARDDETSVVVGLKVGADDYVSKPFSVRELVARVRAHLRRIVWPPGYSLERRQGGVLVLDRAGRTEASVGDEVSMGGGEIRASSGERRRLGVPEPCRGPLWVAAPGVSVSEEG